MRKAAPVLGIGVAVLLLSCQAPGSPAHRQRAVIGCDVPRRPLVCEPAATLVLAGRGLGLPNIAPIENPEAYRWARVRMPGVAHVRCHVEREAVTACRVVAQTRDDMGFGEQATAAAQSLRLPSLLDASEVEFTATFQFGPSQLCQTDGIVTAIC